MTIDHWPSAIGHWPLAIGHRPLAIGHPPSAIGHRQSAIFISLQRGLYVFFSRQHHLYCPHHHQHHQHHYHHHRHHNHSQGTTKCAILRSAIVGPGCLL